MADHEPQPADEAKSVEARLRALEATSKELQKKTAQSGRGLFLSVIAIYAVFASLLILHWAGHVMRHDG